LVKQEKLVSNSLANQLGKNRNLAKLTSRAYICASGSWLPSSFPCRWEGEKRNKEYRRIPEVSFQEVQGYKYNFSKLDLSLTSELCQIIGDELFTGHIFLQVGKTQNSPSKI
jgi:hypothetical protein